MSFISYLENKNSKTLIKSKKYSRFHEVLFEKISLGNIIHLHTIYTKYGWFCFNEKSFHIE